MRLASSVARQRSSGMRETGTSSDGQTPAFATQASSRPRASTAAGTSASASASVAQVGPQRDAADLARERLRCRRVRVVVHADARALGGQQPRGGGPDAARAAGDEDAAPSEPEIHAANPRGV